LLLIDSPGAKKHLRRPAAGVITVILFGVGRLRQKNLDRGARNSAGERCRGEAVDFGGEMPLPGISRCGR
jgi:hypothetical protein